MRKRANGEGSMRKRSNGSWEARVTVGVNPVTGKLISKSVYGKTQKEGREKMANMIKAFFEMSGWHVQFNIVSSEVLHEAQEKPEDYKDLVVRVAGYSALFNDLERKTQDDIIARTEHTL